MFARYVSMLCRSNLFIPIVLITSAWQAQAVHWTLSAANGHTKPSTETENVGG